MPTKQYDFTLDVEKHEAFLAMNFDGVVRARILPAWLLDMLLNYCDEVKRRVISVVQSDLALMEKIPAYPGYVGLAEGALGPCWIRVGASKDEQGEVEFLTSLYDADDDSAPVIMLVNNQLDTFMERIKTLLSSQPHA